MLALPLILFAATAAGANSETQQRTVNLSNIKLPHDQNDERIITGEASALFHDGTYFFYFNNWGSCPGVDCCNSSGGCASCCFDHPPYPIQPCSNPYGQNHSVQVYSTKDFVNWTNLGVALPISQRQAGVEFRPCVVYNKLTRRFLLWYEDRGAGEMGYAVAQSEKPEGPFHTTHVNVSMPGAGKIGDFNIFIDDDGKAYHIRTGFDLVLLNADYTGPAKYVTKLTTPERSEAPVMFKRGGFYYVLAGTDCCACIGGSSIFVLASSSVSGPYKYMGDVGSVPGHIFDPFSPSNYVTKAQASTIFKVGEDNYIWLGNQWNSGLSTSPPGPRNHDLLYWAKLEFDDPRNYTAGSQFNSPPVIRQLEYTEVTTFSWW